MTKTWKELAASMRDYMKKSDAYNYSFRFNSITDSERNKMSNWVTDRYGGPSGFIKNARWALNGYVYMNSNRIDSVFYFKDKDKAFYFWLVWK